MTLSTPNAIEVLLHCYILPEPHPRINAPAVQQALHQLQIAEAIEPVGEGVFRTTAKGDAWVRALCIVPEPTPAFLDANGTPL